MTNKPQYIGIFPSNALQQYQRIWCALSETYPVSFVDYLSSTNDLDAAIFLNHTDSSIFKLHSELAHALIIKPVQQSSSETQPGQIAFTHSLLLDPLFRGRNLHHQPFDLLCSVTPVDGDDIIASIGDNILWLARKSNNTTVHHVAVPLPILNSKQYFADFIVKDNFISSLPLIHFVQTVAKYAGWQRPPIQACLMFDDPNLHAMRYGYVDFPQIALHARKHNYHVSFATIPFDGWYVNRKVASLFFENTQYLSLLIHGNNHIARELGTRDEDFLLRNLAQALRRIDSIELHSGLTIPRVMAAPHGACSEVACNIMHRLGFCGATVSRGSLFHANPNKHWSESFGLKPYEIINGLPVAPRFRISADCIAQATLNAFLGQTIIPTGHHEDLANGFDLLSQVAETINGLNKTAWVNADVFFHSSIPVQNAVDHQLICPPTFAAWPITRRVLKEALDRSPSWLRHSLGKA